MIDIHTKEFREEFLSFLQRNWRPAMIKSGLLPNCSDGTFSFYSYEDRQYLYDLIENNIFVCYRERTEEDGIIHRYYQLNIDIPEIKALYYMCRL